MRILRLLQKYPIANLRDPSRKLRVFILLLIGAVKALRGCDCVLHRTQAGESNYCRNDRLRPVQQVATGVAIGSRLRNETSNQMPLWRLTGNKLLTNVANTLFKTNQTDLHSGARIYPVELLKQIPFEYFNDGFLFDQQMLAFCLATGVEIAEFSIPANYDNGVSSIGFTASLHYGLGCLLTLIRAKRGIGPHYKNRS